MTINIRTFFYCEECHKLQMTSKNIMDWRVSSWDTINEALEHLKEFPEHMIYIKSEES